MNDLIIIYKSGNFNSKLKICCSAAYGIKKAGFSPLFYATVVFIYAFIYKMPVDGVLLAAFYVFIYAIPVDVELSLPPFTYSAAERYASLNLK